MGAFPAHDLLFPLLFFALLCLVLLCFAVFCFALLCFGPAGEIARGDALRCFALLCCAWGRPGGIARGDFHAPVSLDIL